jgi:quercetin dioxygenase-like cupin family protein
MNMVRKFLVIGAIVSAVGASAFAQVKRTPIQTVDFPPGFTTVTALFEIAPGTCTGRHTHPGVEMSYLLEGNVVLKVAGQPDQRLKADGSFHVQPNTPHDACPAPGQGVKGLGTFVVEKGKPLATPAP